MSSFFSNIPLGAIMRKNFVVLILFLIITFSQFLQAQDAILGELIHDGPATPEQISLYLPVTGTLDESIIAYVNYKKNTDANWLVAHPLHRIRPALTSRTPPKPAFAGVIWDLTPGTKYDIEIKIKINGKDTSKKISLTTRALPVISKTPPKIITSGTDQKKIQEILNAAQPGEIIEFANGTYTFTGLQLTKGGSLDKPIAIRGKSKEGVILKAATGTIIQILECSHVIIENLTLEGSKQDSGTKSASKAIVFHTTPNPQENFTFRNLLIKGVDMGIIATKAIRGVLIYNNKMIGNNLWQKDIITTNSTWNDDGIRIPGQGNSAFNNYLTGFGDSLAMNDGVLNVAIHFYRNEIFSTGDDAFEGDYGHRNITFYDNRIHNSQTFISMDPLLGGPAFCFRNISINTGRGPYKLNNQNSGLFIYNNTVVRTNGFGSGKDWGWVQFNNGPIDGWGYCNNILIWQGKGEGGTFAMESSGQKIIDFTNNAWYPDGGFWWTTTGGCTNSFEQILKKLPATKPVFGLSTKRQENDVLLDKSPFIEPIVLGPDFLTEIKKQYEPALTKTSTAKNKGVPIPGVTDGFIGKAPDIGAVVEGRKPPIRGVKQE